MYFFVGAGKNKGHNSNNFKFKLKTVKGNWKMILQFWKIYDVSKKSIFLSEHLYWIIFQQIHILQGLLSEPGFVSRANNGVIEVEAFCLTRDVVKRWWLQDVWNNSLQLL